MQEPKHPPHLLISLFFAFDTDRHEKVKKESLGPPGTAGLPVWAQSSHPNPAATQATENLCVYSHTTLVRYLQWAIRDEVEWGRVGEKKQRW